MGGRCVCVKVKSSIIDYVSHIRVLLLGIL